MRWDRRWSRPLTAASTAFGAAIVLFGWLAFHSLRREAGEPEAQGVPDGPRYFTPAPVLQRAIVPESLRRIAVEANPFRPDRQPAEVAFRMPADPAVAGPALAASAPISLVGTAVMPGEQSFAMCQLGSEPPRVVRIGGRIGEYTLRTVEQGKATFRSAQGATIEVHVPKIGS